jgi:A/G-specific adenine glycosylase
MSSFATRLLNWFHRHGRHDLPWQKDRSAYRVWVSEIMLQQTQVNTVIPYFERFIQNFPDIDTLAHASNDEVMLHWAGLGYYSRARNLHQAAQIILQDHDGKFPEEYEQVLALPGIGPSTAGAILAQALGQRHAILDGNVKRVLARHEAISGWPGQTPVAKQLWLSAERYTPQEEIVDYTQAIMDLGATVCTRSSPECTRCPLAEDCKAYQVDRVDEFPGKKARKKIPVRTKRLLIIRNQHGHYLMEKRPPSGIWGGLWSLPELELEDSVDEAVMQNWQLTADEYKDLPVFRHTFSHFHLDITPCEVNVSHVSQGIADDGRFQWQSDIQQLALAAPVSAIFQIK